MLGGITLSLCLPSSILKLVTGVGLRGQAWRHTEFGEELTETRENS